jgi:hypothetical protein
MAMLILIIKYFELILKLEVQMSMSFNAGEFQYRRISLLDNFNTEQSYASNSWRFNFDGVHTSDTNT